MLNVEAPTQAIRRRFRAGMWRTKMHNAVSRTEAKQRLPKGFCSALRTETTLEQGKVWPGFKDADSHAISSATLGQHTLGYSSLPVGKKTILTGRSGVTDLSNRGGGHGAHVRGDMYYFEPERKVKSVDGYRPDERDTNPNDFLVNEKKRHEYCSLCGKVYLTCRCEYDDYELAKQATELAAKVEARFIFDEKVTFTHARLGEVTLTRKEFLDRIEPFFRTGGDAAPVPTPCKKHAEGVTATKPLAITERLSGPTTDATLRPHLYNTGDTEWRLLQDEKERLVQHYCYTVNKRGDYKFSRTTLWLGNHHVPVKGKNVGERDYKDVAEKLQRTFVTTLTKGLGKVQKKRLRVDERKGWSPDLLSKALSHSDVPEWVSLNLKQRKLRPYVVFERTQHQTVLERELRPVESINFGWHAYLYKSAGVPWRTVATPVGEAIAEPVELAEKSLKPSRTGRYYGNALIYGENGHTDKWLGNGFDDSPEYTGALIKSHCEMRQFSGNTKHLPLSEVDAWIENLSNPKTVECGRLVKNPTWREEGFQETYISDAWALGVRGYKQRLVFAYKLRPAIKPEVDFIAGNKTHLVFFSDDVTRSFHPYDKTVNKVEHRLTDNQSAITVRSKPASYKSYPSLPARKWDEVLDWDRPRYGEYMRVAPRGREHSIHMEVSVRDLPLACELPNYHQPFVPVALDADCPSDTGISPYGLGRFTRVEAPFTIALITYTHPIRKGAVKKVEIDGVVKITYRTGCAVAPNTCDTWYWSLRDVPPYECKGTPNGSEQKVLAYMQSHRVLPRPICIKGVWTLRFSDKKGAPELSFGELIRNKQHRVEGVQVDTLSWTEARTHCNFTVREYLRLLLVAQQENHDAHVTRYAALRNKWMLKEMICYCAGGTAAWDFEQERLPKTDALNKSVLQYTDWHSQNVFDVELNWNGEEWEMKEVEDSITNPLVPPADESDVETDEEVEE